MSHVKIVEAHSYPISIVIQYSNRLYKFQSLDVRLPKCVHHARPLAFIHDRILGWPRWMLWFKPVVSDRQAHSKKENMSTFFDHPRSHNLMVLSINSYTCAHCNF